MSIRATTNDSPNSQFSDDFATSVIDRHSSFEGTFRSERDLRVEGEVKGAIECKGTVFVADGANIQATVDAEHVTVAGELNGEVRCRGRLQIMPTGRLGGKVVTQSLIIDEGAFYEGQLEMAGTDSRATNAGGRLTSMTASPAPSAPTRQASPVAAAASAPNASSGDQPPSATFIRRFGGPETPWSNPDEGDDATENDPKDA